MLVETDCGFTAHEAVEEVVGIAAKGTDHSNACDSYSPTRRLAHELLRVKSVGCKSVKF